MTATLLDRPTTVALSVHVRRGPETPPQAPAHAAPPVYATTPAASPRVRLTRRGRALRSLLVLVIGLLVVTAALVRGGAPAVGSDGAVPVQPQTVVQPGETLWSIAQRVAPGADPRSTVLQLKELNGLTSSRLDAGQPLLLPIDR